MDIHPCPECGEPVTLDTAETCGVCAREMHPHCLARFHDRAACKRPTAYPEPVQQEN